VSQQFHVLHGIAWRDYLLMPLFRLKSTGLPENGSASPDKSAWQMSLLRLKLNVQNRTQRQ